ncbi:hypothetical protein BGZ49_007866 [Haplosporangium sp. Z 27]|nr:hypothetical protein BGZ49_007866 [Haplosporangium sp. Z 27]
MFLRYTAFFLLLISSALISNVQSYQPLVTFAASSTFIEGQAIYILGGVVVANVSPTSVNFIQQSFMIDLSQPWNTSNPVYKQLPNGPEATAYAASLSPNGQDLFTLANGTIYMLDLKSSSWSPILTNPNISRSNGLSAVTDPNAGMVYVPYGYNSIDNLNSTSTSMLVINLNTKVVNSIPIDPRLDSSYFYATVWSAQYSSMFILSSGPSGNLFTYTSALGWKNITSNGYNPSPRSSSCLVSAFGGSKLILFGGIDLAGATSLNDIYTLDIHTMTWTRGPDVDETNGRGFAACAFSNGNFIVWGGANAVNGNAVVPRDNVLVFDTIVGNWTTMYNPLLSPSNSTTNSSTSNNNSPNTTAKNGSHTVIIACVVAVIIIVMIIIAAVMFYRRQSRRAQVSPSFYNNNAEKSMYPPSSMPVNSPMVNTMGFPDKESYCSSYSTTPTPMLVVPVLISTTEPLPPPNPLPLSLPAPIPAPVYFQNNDSSSSGFQQLVAQPLPNPIYPQGLSRNEK